MATKVTHFKNISSVDGAYYTGKKGSEVLVVSTTRAFTGTAVTATTVTATTNITAGKQFLTGVSALSTGTTITVTATAADIFTLTPSTTATLLCSDATAGMQKKIIITATATACVLTFGTGFLTTGTLATGTAANKVFMLSLASGTTILNETGRTTAM
jgi:hypothetical protein